jgi:hypothetical protein
MENLCTLRKNYNLVALMVPERELIKKTQDSLVVGLKIEASVRIEERFWRQPYDPRSSRT